MDRATRGWQIAGGLVVAVLLLSSFWLRVFSLQTLPLMNADEAYYGLQTARLLKGESFEARTTSGNILSPLFVATQALVLPMTGPTIWGLRLPAVLGGLVAVALAARVGGRIIGSEGAAIAAVAAATMPAAILFARIGCEFSQTPIVGFVAAGLAWRGRALSFAAWIGFGLLVHPTNVLNLACFGPLLAFRIVALHPDSWRRRWVVGFVATCAVTLPFALLMASNQNVRGHASDSRALGHFVDGFGRFLSFAALPAMSDGEVAAHRWAFRIGLGALLAAGGTALIRRRRWDQSCLVLGVLIGLVGFDLAAGAEVLDGAAKRYGAVLIAPTALALAALMAAPLAMIPSGRWRSAASTSVLLIGGVGALILAERNAIRPYLDERSDLLRLGTRDPFGEAAGVIRADLRRRSASGAGIVAPQDIYVNGVQYAYLFSDDAIEVAPFFTLFEVWVMRQLPDGSGVEGRRERLARLLERGGYAVAQPGTPRDRGGGLIAETLATRYDPDRVRRWSNGSQEVYRLERPTVALESASPTTTRR